MGLLFIKDFNSQVKKFGVPLGKKLAYSRNFHVPKFLKIFIFQQQNLLIFQLKYPPSFILSGLSDQLIALAFFVEFDAIIDSTIALQ